MDPFYFFCSRQLRATVSGSPQPEPGTRSLATNINTVASGLKNGPGLDVFLTGCSPIPALMDAYAAQHQQKLSVCTNPSKFWKSTSFSQ
ncbi:unnamed protein product [Trichobilharzia regenti]|nr:unnamed protein product [Trichobilharzia regenti]